MPTPRIDDSDDPVLTTAAAARLLGVAVSTTQLWLESGALPSWKTPGGHRRVRLSAVTRLLSAKAGQAPPRAGPATDPEFRPGHAPGHPVPPDEKARLAAVAASGLVDSAPEPVFDRLTWLATQVTDCPMALVTVLTSRRQWFKARTGVDLAETPRDWAFCSHAIVQEEPLMVEDASRDARFAANPLVTGPLRVRFYAGVPLVDAGGHALGTLCVLDREPRRLRAREIKALQELAAIAVEELRRRT
ncbi:excisionase [Massilia sp. Root133]|uniref:GAF domain-containing protein n=1 Tax=unclassified Massilia TaxID=2609279 RepID=UPI0006F2BBE3|nr:MULTISPECIES: GAF domain-containing protein [unclassified Massilia]KQY16963.1 excisionase [Massilia sp. Root133]KQZ46184.1 excisionase [Massilia sp. Root1485]